MPHGANGPENPFRSEIVCCHAMSADELITESLVVKVEIGLHQNCMRGKKYIT